VVKKGQYLNGKKSGKWILFNDCKVIPEHKNTVETGEFVDDKKNGKWERLKNDKVIASFYYEKDVLNGEHICFVNGKISEKRKFEAGNLKMLEILNETEQLKVKYAIADGDSTYTCEKTAISKDGTVLKNFLVDKKQEGPLDCMNFTAGFESADKVAEGLFQRKAMDNQIIEEGNFKNNLKSGKWINFYYDKKVKTEFDYNEKGEIIAELYTDLKKNEPFSGEFDYFYEDKSGSEERKIKDGKRNGTTRYKDANDKTIKKESYKDGVLKVEN
jgi:antitoxin component YwqK of YwqJK toxin-antitoxin module